MNIIQKPHWCLPFPHTYSNYIFPFAMNSILEQFWIYRILVKGEQRVVMYSYPVSPVINILHYYEIYIIIN